MKDSPKVFVRGDWKFEQQEFRSYLATIGKGDFQCNNAKCFPSLLWWIARPTWAVRRNDPNFLASYCMALEKMAAQLAGALINHLHIFHNFGDLDPSGIVSSATNSRDLLSLGFRRALFDLKTDSLLPCWGAEKYKDSRFGQFYFSAERMKAPPMPIDKRDWRITP